MSILIPVLAAVLATNGVNAAGTTNVSAKASPPARITSDSTFYDRKEGVAVFKGNVHVDDSDYQMHAKRAYVFMNTASNTLSRIVATGDVALTNGTKRAYGEKVTYRRDDGLVVLHGDGAGHPATIIDVTPQGERRVEGSKIRFWINTEQVEVLDATMKTPRPAGAAARIALPGGK